MTRGTFPRVDVEPASIDTPADRMLFELRRSVQAIWAGAETRLFAPDPDSDALSDVEAALTIHLGDRENPVALAAHRREVVTGVWPGTNRHGTAVPLVVGGDLRGVAWFVTRPDEPTEAAAPDALSDLATSFIRSLLDLEGWWSAERYARSLEVARRAGERLVSETGLHRALRLIATDLAGLSGAREVSFWQFTDPALACVALAGSDAPDPRCEAAMRRVLHDLREAPRPLRVLSTRRSESFRWCHAEGISRFLARPILSRDRLFGALIAVDFRLRPPLFGSGPEPGAEEALALAVQAAAAAFHEIAQREALSRQAEEARAQRRLAERHEHDAANLELCRRASRALAGELAGLADALGGAGAAAPGDRSAEPTDALQSRLARALDILDEIDALADQGPARLRVASLNDVIAEVVERFRSGAGGTRAEISLRADGDIPRLLLDTDRIRDLITNLIDHGLSGTEERRGEITTRLQKGQVVAELRFPGRSAPGGAIESLFAPFGLDDATGFSLGLSLADQLVREHGGQLRVRSEPGEGLSYWLSLPVRENQERRRRRPDRRGGLDRRRS